MDGTPFGRYRLIELLGRGGMGEVWRAFDTAIDRMVALKLLPANLADDPVFRERFRREAKAAAGLDEPHVVPIHDYGEIDGRLYVTMRLIKGRDLQTILADGPLAPERAVRIVEQVAQALQAAHRIGLIHRDIKPSNILLAEDDFAYLIDFGIARAAGETGLTSTGAAIGTWAYMSPERLNTGHADARADIYALTCVLHEALTGQRPYPGDSLEQQIVGHLTSPPPRPSMLQPGVPQPMDAVIAKGMAKQPDQRYASTVELARAARDATTAPIQRPTPSFAPEPPTEQVTSPVTALTVEHDPRRQPPPSAFASAATQRRPEPLPAPAPQPESSAIGQRIFSAAAPPGSPPLPVEGFQDQRRKRRTKIALITSGVAIIAIAGVVLAVLPSTGSPSKTAGPSSPTAFSPPPPVVVSALDGLLLSADQGNTAMGATGMTVVQSETNLVESTAVLSDKNCLAVADPAERPVYAGSRWTAARVQFLRQPGDKETEYVDQAVVLFPAATDAAAFFTASTSRWQSCANRQYTDDQSRATNSVGAVSNTDGLLSARITPEGGNGWNCQRALTVRNNVAVDVNACSYRQGDFGINIAQQIAAKVPTQ